MKPFYITLGLLILLAYSSCKKSDIAPVTFSNITVTDASCLYISNIDTTDWGYDEGWYSYEYNFISFNDSVRITDSLAGYVQVSAICANPNDGRFTWNVNTGRQCMLRMAIVNTDMQIVYYAVKRLPGGPVTYQYDFSANTSFHKNEYYRLYYGFYTSKDSLYYKGHGDIRLE
ncbi:MAG TPA: hypothetical protein PLW44_14850 [Chitinophagales bacterium]|nr:hypothetical protein [Chitinophagales bacterium]